MIWMERFSDPRLKVEHRQGDMAFLTQPGALGRTRMKRWQERQNKVRGRGKKKGKGKGREGHPRRPCMHLEGDLKAT